MKKTRPLIRTSLALVACAAITSLPLQTTHAQNNIFLPAAGNWTNTANWSLAALPAVGTTAIMNNARVVSVNNVIGTTAGNINVANQLAGFTGGMDVNAGGSLSYQGNLFIGAAGATGLVQIQGGSLTSVNTGARIVMQGQNGGINSTFAISSGSFTAQGSAAADALDIRGVRLDISGGTVDMSGGQMRTLLNPTISVFGDAATIQVGYLNSAAGTTTATYNFAFGSSGISSIDSAAWMHLGGATINVDGSAYTGGAGSFNLFTSVNLASTPLAQYITSPFDGYDTAFSVADNNLVLTLTAVPEPTTFALLGLGSLALVLAKRRR
jgi:hypothetical protein